MNSGNDPRGYFVEYQCLKSFIGRQFDEMIHFPEVTEKEYRKLMLFSVYGIFLILLVLLAALVMTAGNIRPWEDKPCGSR